MDAGRSPVIPGGIDAVFVLPDKPGGVFSFVSDLVSHQGNGALRYRAVLTRNALAGGELAPASPGGIECARLAYEAPVENIHAYLRRLRRIVGDTAGVLVTSDWVELAMASAYPTQKTVFTVIHGDAQYYYDLARMHEPWIDCFITLSNHMTSRLKEEIPGRAGDIHHLAPGVKIPAKIEKRRERDLRLLFVGRLERAKGVFDLPQIDSALAARGVGVSWTIVGSGEDEAELKGLWNSRSSVKWCGSIARAEVFPLYDHHDVLVLPSRAEGLPITLLEAGAAGLVPVASSLKSGIPDVVDDGVHGFLRPPGNAQAFATAIEQLATEDGLLQRMSEAVSDRVRRDFDVHTRTAAYEDLFSRWKALKRPLSPPGLRYGSRLDRPWLPNALVKSVRRALR